MPRLKPILNRDDLPEEGRHAHDYLIKTRGNVAPAMGILLNSPELGERVAHLGTYVRFESGLPANIRELAALTSACEVNNRVEIGAHLRMAPQAGVSEKAVKAISGMGPLDGLSEEEALPARFVRELLREHHVSDATYQALHAILGDKGIVDFCATTGYYALLACVFNALEVEPSRL